MSNCQICDSKLVTVGLNSGQQIRCANCKSLSWFGKVEKVATHNLAWRSFWLGISSILLLTITGIPAVYYGIRSLLRMRFVKPARSDRAAAIIGTLMGGLFGIFIGFVAACFLIVSLIRFWTDTETTDSIEVAQQCSQVFEFSSPHVDPVRASSAMNSHYLFEFADQPEFESRKLAIHLAFVRAGLQPNDAAIKQQLQKRLGKTKFGDIHESDFMDWQFNREPINVKKSIYSRAFNTGPDKETREETHRHYWGFIRNDEGLYGMSVIFEPGYHDLSDEEVKEIFAATSIKLD